MLKNIQVTLQILIKYKCNWVLIWGQPAHAFPSLDLLFKFRYGGSRNLEQDRVQVWIEVSRSNLGFDSGLVLTLSSKPNSFCPYIKLGTKIIPQLCAF